MSILVRKVDGAWQEWHGSSIVTQMVSTYTGVYADGRQVEIPCDPYPVEIQMNGERLRGFYDQGIWTIEEVEAVGAKIAVPFQVPDGKQVVGPPEYVETDGVVKQVHEIEDVPPPEVLPSIGDRVGSMLAGYDLSISDLKSILGLSV